MTSGFSFASIVASLVRCAAFPAFLLGILAVTTFVHIDFIARYDLIALLCVAYQIAMLLTRIETPREFATIFIFHAMGVGLEIFKVNHGGWSYPESAWAKIAGVPLYSGFMYASIGSFLLAGWKEFRVVPSEFPSTRTMTVFAVAAYGNYFANFWISDLKPVLLVFAIVLFWKSRLNLSLPPHVSSNRPIALPVLLLFPVMGVAIWFAENWATRFGSWQYPRQSDGWTFVPPDKLLSWTVLVMISFLLVWLSRWTPAKETDGPSGGAEE